MNITPTLEYLNQLFRDAGHVELRHQIDGRWETAWFSSADDLIIEARRRSGAGNLFTSLNHVQGPTTGPIVNDAVDRYTRILFDLDPDRPKDTPSTDDELADARELAKGIRRHLSSHGWPRPAIGMSGNGVHLQYRTALPNTPEIRSHLSAIYAGLKERFSDDVVRFDTSVKNPGRICTLYGSTKRKGSNTQDRPHRKSFILIPLDWQQVRPWQIEKLGTLYAPKPAETQAQRPQDRPGASIVSGTGDYSSLDVVGWFQAHDGYIRWIADNMHAVVCPWSDEHSTAGPPHGGDTIVFEQDGSWAGFHCKHDHCADRTIRDVIALWGDADRYCGQAYRREVQHV